MSGRRRDRIAASLVVRMPLRLLIAATHEFVRRADNELMTISINDKPAVLLIDLDPGGPAPTQLGPEIIQILAGAREME